MGSGGVGGNMGNFIGRRSENKAGSVGDEARHTRQG